jgi:hypothetical protein
MSFTVREERESDLPGVSALRDQALEEHQRFLLPPEATPSDLDKFDAIWHHPEAKFLVAETDGTIVGRVGWLPFDAPSGGDASMGKAAEAFALYVAPAGREGPAAGALLTGVELAAKASGAAIVEMGVEDWLADVVALLDRTGYARCGPPRTVEDWRLSSQWIYRKTV